MLLTGCQCGPHPCCLNAALLLGEQKTGMSARGQAHGKTRVGTENFFILSPDVKSRGHGEITGTRLKEMSVALLCTIELV